MTPQEFHETCHEACMECPQFQPYDDDQEILGWGEFGSIPKRGWLRVIKFWKEDRLLWEMGYYKTLPDEVTELFDEIDKAFERAILEVVGKN